jgi:transposase-like protein
MSETTAAFIPPFCPRKRCKHHTSSTGFRWVRYGTYSTQSSTRRTQRYRCLHCRRTFSATAFRNTYYAKRPELLVPLGHRLVACSGFRQMAREMRCAASTLMRQAARIGRQALLRMAAMLPSEPLAEPLVVDGFESFSYSQYHPCYVNIAVGARSHHTYAFTFSPLRRKGRMTEPQRRRRARIEAKHGRPDPRAIERGTAELLRIACRAPQAIVVRTDEHPAYPRALRRLAHLEVTHERTPSVQARTTGNPLFAVNLVDGLLRHNSANHKRETIAFSKHAPGLIERVAWLLVWRNCCKPFSENHGGGTPAMRAGRLERPSSVEQLLRWRLFPKRVAVPQAWERYYDRLEHAPGTREARPHTLENAY